MNKEIYLQDGPHDSEWRAVPVELKELVLFRPQAPFYGDLVAGMDTEVIQHARGSYRPSEADESVWVWGGWES